MRKLIAWIFRLYTKEEVEEIRGNAIEVTRECRRVYYQKVLDELHRSGSLPPNVDLKIPKQSIVMEDSETHEAIASEGKWKKLPMDGQLLKIKYIAI